MAEVPLGMISMEVLYLILQELDQKLVSAVNNVDILGYSLIQGLFTSMFSYKSCIALDLVFSFMIHSELIFYRV